MPKSQPLLYLAVRYIDASAATGNKFLSYQFDIHCNTVVQINLFLSIHVFTVVSLSQECADALKVRLHAKFATNL